MKEIAGFPGYYATDDGRIISNKRSKQRELKQSVNKKTNYLYVQVMKDNKAYTRHVHKLVALAYFGEHDGLHVDHIDRDRTNNNVSNLRIVTRSENLLNNGSPRYKISLVNNNGYARYRITERHLGKRTYHGHYEKLSDAEKKLKKLKAFC